MFTLPIKSGSSVRTHPRAAWIFAAAFFLAAQAYATPPLGFTAQASRGRITENVGAHQWSQNPLFTLLIQSSGDQWGYDVVQITAELAPMDAMGRPSQSGWHDHPTAITIGLVIQGTVWLHQGPNLNCARAIPTGSVFFERSGAIHNNYNFDPRNRAVVQVLHFVDRNETAIRRDQPDQVTGDPMNATPPTPCPAQASAANAGVESPTLANGSGQPPEGSRHMPAAVASGPRRQRQRETE